MTDDDRLSERERLIDLLADLTVFDAEAPEVIADRILAAGWVPPERVREAERRGAVEALRKAAFWTRCIEDRDLLRDRADRLDQDEDEDEDGES